MLVLLFALALVVRIGVALALDHRNRQRGVEHEFADTELYCTLARAIAAGEPLYDGKRYLMRTPGYPLFLAGCFRLFGESSVGARHAQAAVGAASCVLLFLLVRQLVDSRTAWTAAVIAALYPFGILLSVILLSEAVFGAVLLVQLLTLGRLLRAVRGGDPSGRLIAWSTLAGLLGAAATLVRPSWILATPAAALLLVLTRGRRSQASRDTNPSLQPLSPRGEGRGVGGEGSAPPGARAIAGLCLLLGFLCGMCPWWVRNWRVTGHFVPTTLWVGASLYDGLNPKASGASDMRFMDNPKEFGLDPGLRELDEWEQDQYLRREAFRYVRSRPDRVFVLAAIKFARFWNPLPNAAEWQSWPLRIVSLMSCGPVLVLAIVGAWRLRHRAEVTVLLAGPVLYFAAIHLVFVSSIRYREAAMLPVLGLAAAGLASLAGVGKSQKGRVGPVS